jgi:hypothetical protein
MLRPLLLPLLTHFALSLSQPTTNLPPPATPGVFTASTRILIPNTTASLAYAALTNFPAYSTWNPFVRAAIVVSPLNITLPSQRPTEGLNLFLRVQIPPLPLPVNSNTPDNPLATQFSYELITHVQPELGRLAWKYTPDTLLQSERWQAVSDVGDGTVLYESREVFDGVLAGVLRDTLGEKLQRSFEAQGKGLKRLLSGGV